MIDTEGLRVDDCFRQHYFYLSGADTCTGSYKLAVDFMLMKVDAPASNSVLDLQETVADEIENQIFN